MSRMVSYVEQITGLSEAVVDIKCVLVKLRFLSSLLL